MKRPYKDLRRLVEDRDMTEAELAARIDRAPVYLSRRFNGHVPFDSDDIKAISEVLNIARSDIGLYFFHELPDRPEVLDAGTPAPPDWLTNKNNGRRARA